MSSLEVTDRESAAVAVTPNRVSLKEIEANIAHEFFMNAAEAAYCLDQSTPYKGPLPITALSLSVLTICILVMKNGFTIIGKAAPADEKNFNAELGKKFAREDAIRQAWPLMGYALRERLCAK